MTKHPPSPQIDDGGDGQRQRGPEPSDQDPRTAWVREDMPRLAVCGPRPGESSAVMEGYRPERPFWNDALFGKESGVLDARPGETKKR